MVTDEMIEAFGNAFWSVNAASKIDGQREHIRSALEAALSTDAEPTIYVSRKSLEELLEAKGNHVALQTLIHRKPLKSGNGVPLFAAPVANPVKTAPAVAVKPGLVTPQMLIDTACWCQDEQELRDTLKMAAAALSAQVQDVACETCNGTGNEARHQICRDCDDSVIDDPAQLEQNSRHVAGWLPIETAKKDRTIMLLWSSSWLHPIMGYWSAGQNCWLEYASRDTKANIATHWMSLPASPASKHGDAE